VSRFARLRLAVVREPLDAQGADTARPQKRLARSLHTEREWSADRESMRAALRVVLGLPRVLPGRGDGGQR